MPFDNTEIALGHFKDRIDKKISSWRQSHTLPKVIVQHLSDELKLIYKAQYSFDVFKDLLFKAFPKKFGFSYWQVDFEVGNHRMMFNHLRNGEFESSQLSSYPKDHPIFYYRALNLYHKYVEDKIVSEKSPEKPRLRGAGPENEKHLEKWRTLLLNNLYVLKNKEVAVLSEDNSILEPQSCLRALHDILHRKGHCQKKLGPIPLQAQIFEEILGMKDGSINTKNYSKETQSYRDTLSKIEEFNLLNMPNQQSGN